MRARQVRRSEGLCSGKQGGITAEVRLQTTARTCLPGPHVDEHCTANQSQGSRALHSQPMLTRSPKRWMHQAMAKSWSSDNL